MASRLAIRVFVLAALASLLACEAPQADPGAAPAGGITATAEMFIAPQVATEAKAQPASAAPMTEVDVQPQVDQLKKQLAPGGPDLSQQGLIFDSTKVDFGKLKSTAGILSATFHAVNRTGKLIQIVRTEKDCGCLLSKPVPNQLQPGQSLDVMLQMNPAGRNGRLSHLFTIITNEEVPYYFLNMQADVELVKGADQPNIYIPSLVRGTTEHVQVIIESASQVLPRAKIELHEPNLELTRTQVDGATLDLWLTTSPGAIHGKIPARLIIRDPTTDQEVTTVPMVVVIDDNVHFNTPSIFLGRMKPGQPATKEVQLMCYFGDVPKVIRAKLEPSDGPAREMGTVEVVTTPVAKLVRVTADPDAAQGPIYRATLRVELESAAQPEALLPVLGIVEQKPQTLDFSKSPTRP